MVHREGDMLLKSLCLFFALLLPISVVRAEDVNVTIDASQAGQVVPPGFLGFSREWRVFVAPDGGPSEAVHPAYLRLIEQISAFNKQGPCFRIGGNSADGMGSSPEEARWRQIAKIYETTKTPVIINLNLARENAELDKTMIRDALKVLPSGAVMSFELGNEPDGWAGRYRPKDYTFEQYLPVFRKVGSELVPSLTPGLAGPAYAHGAAVGPITEFLKAEQGLVNLVTVHSYRFDPKSKPKVERLLDDRDTKGFAARMADGIKVVHDAGMKIRLTETGSAWGGGIAGFSDSFGAAIWTLDVLFETAMVGLDGIHFHGGGLGNYTPIREDVDKATKKAIITARAPYYGMRVFAEAVANEARIVPVEVSAGTKTKVWATVDAKGTMRFVLINKDTDRQASDVMMAVQGGHASVKRLMARELAATDGFTFDGQTYDGSADGNPVGKVDDKRVTVNDGLLRVRVNACSVALVTVLP